MQPGFVALVFHCFVLFFSVAQCCLLKQKKPKQFYTCLSSRVLIEKMMSSSTGDGSSAASWKGDYINIKETSPPGWACCWCTDCTTCFCSLPLSFVFKDSELSSLYIHSSSLSIAAMAWREEWKGGRKGACFLPAQQQWQHGAVCAQGWDWSFKTLSTFLHLLL